MHLFIDTWGWIALYNRAEERHAGAKEAYQAVRRANGEMVTTDYVMDETLTLLFKRVSFDRARTFIHQVDAAVQTGTLQLEWIGPDRFEKAEVVRSCFQDKPKTAFTRDTNEYFPRANACRAGSIEEDQAIRRASACRGR